MWSANMSARKVEHSHFKLVNIEHFPTRNDIPGELESEAGVLSVAERLQYLRSSLDVLPRSPVGDSFLDQNLLGAGYCPPDGISLQLRLHQFHTWTIQDQTQSEVQN